MSSPSPNQPTPDERREKALQDVAEARRLLDSLRSEIESHPKLEAAIVKLELALESLTLQTGGML